MYLSAGRRRKEWTIPATGVGGRKGPKRGEIEKKKETTRRFGDALEKGPPPPSGPATKKRNNGEGKAKKKERAVLKFCTTQR